MLSTVIPCMVTGGHHLKGILHSCLCLPSFTVAVPSEAYASLLPHTEIPQAGHIIKQANLDCDVWDKDFIRSYLMLSINYSKLKSYGSAKGCSHNWDCLSRAQAATFGRYSASSSSFAAAAINQSSQMLCM